MSKATLLLVGPGLPYHVLDYAIKWAKENEGSLRTLFVVPGEIPEEGYPFPNDLDETESLTNNKDAENGIREIVRQESRFIEKRCNASHVPVTIEILFSPSIQKLLVTIKDSEIIFFNKRAEENPDELNDLSFSIDEIMKKASGQFVAVGEKDEYSDAVS